ncbi:MAG: ABC transporter substrate-binding protein [Nitrospirae bacterium]|nr:ABC transporter substrate-binding protein [Nitrospirota bacterium]
MKNSIKTAGKIFFLTVFFLASTFFTPPLFASGKKKIDLTIWTLFSGGGGFIMTGLIEQFNKEHPDINIEEQKIEWGAYYTKLLTALISGYAPDIAVMHLAILPDYASKGVLNDIGKDLPAAFKDNILKEVINRAYYKGQLYAVPIDAHPLVMYYNKKILKEAGLVNARGEVLLPKTWDELFKYAKQIKDVTGKWGLTSETGAMLGERWWISLYSQLGGVFDPQKHTVDVKIAAKTYEMILKFYEQGVAFAGGDYAEHETIFINGGTGYHFNGVWGMAIYPITKGLEFGVTSIPAIPGSKPFTETGSHSFVFPKKRDKKKLAAALTFAQWLSAHSLEWAKAGQIPVNKTVLNSEALLNLPMRKDYIGVAKNVVYPPSMNGYPQLREQMWELGQRVIEKDLTPEEAAKALNKKIKEITEG